jgi:chemotaxis protein MotB
VPFGKEETMEKSREHVLSVIIVMLATALIGAGCTKYKKQIASQATEITTLQNENQKLKDEKADAEAKLAALGIDKNACEDGSKTLQAKIAEYEAQIAALSQKTDELEAQLDAMGTGKDKLAKNLADKEAMLKELQKEKAQAKRRLETLKNMLGKFQKLIEAGKLNVKIRNGKMVLELPSAILFESGKAELSE